jgi:hypothetical protein
MSREIKLVDYADEIIRLQNRAGQCETELVGIADDLKYVAPAVEQLKALAKTFRPAPESHGMVQINANVKKQNPIEELAILLQKIQFASESLNRVSQLLAERRSALAELLK